MVKIKINNLTISLRKATGYTQGSSHKATGWLFSQNFAGHKEKHIILKVLKEKTTITKTKNKSLFRQQLGEQLGWRAQG